MGYGAGGKTFVTNRTRMRHARIRIHIRAYVRTNARESMCEDTFMNHGYGKRGRRLIEREIEGEKERERECSRNCEWVSGCPFARISKSLLREMNSCVVAVRIQTKIGIRFFYLLFFISSSISRRTSLKICANL